MLLYLLKPLFSFIFACLRVFIFNRELPSVKASYKNIHFGRHRLQTLDVFQPEGKGPYPVLIYIHGGGFAFSDKSTVNRICHCFAHEGMLVFNINHRLTPDFHYPTQMQDVTNAIQWVVEHAGEYNGDTTRIFMAGDSSGAYLACWYTAAINKPELQQAADIKQMLPIETFKGLLLFYGPYDLDTVMQGNFPLKDILIPAFIGKREPVAERIHIASPARHISPKFPPTFLCAGEPDPLYSESVALEKVLKANGVPCEALFFSREEYPESEHGFLNFYKRPCSKLAMEKVLQFIRQ